MTVNCPHCQGGIEYNHATAGSVIRCPYCSQQLTMPPEDDFRLRLHTSSPTIRGKPDRTIKTILAANCIMLSFMVLTMLYNRYEAYHAEKKMQRVFQEAEDNMERALRVLRAGD